MRPFGPRSSTDVFRVAAGSVRRGFILSLVGLSAIAAAQTQWHTDLAEARKLAASTGKPMFVDFCAEWCGPCKMLGKDVFSDGRVKALFQKTVCVRLDIDLNQQEAQKLSVTSIPRLMLFSPDGKQVLWDTMGYREADEFVQELSDALHMKPPAAIPAEPEPVPLAKVRAALGTPGGLAHLQATDPVDARAGLKMLVAKLGVYKEEDFHSPATLLVSAGTQAMPALIDGMNSKTLAVRVGSYKVVQTIVSKSKIQNLKSRVPFDPWAGSAVREKQLAAWRKFARVL